MSSLRHGHARRLTLSVTAGDDRLELELGDDGCGLPPGGVQRAGHYGLRWLGERVEGLGGTLRLEAAAPHGVRLSVSLPLAMVAA